MKLKSTLPFPVEVAHLGLYAEPGDVVEVPDDAAQELLDSGAWVSAEPKPKTAPKEK